MWHGAVANPNIVSMEFHLRRQGRATQVRTRDQNNCPRHRRAISPEPTNTKKYIRKIRTHIGQVILSSNPCNNDRILPCDPCDSGISFSLPLLRFMGNEDCGLEECASDVRARLRYRRSGWCSWVLATVWVASSRSRSFGRSGGTDESFLGE